MMSTYQLLQSNLYFITIAIVRILLAIVLGSFIGYEREQTNRPAGVRTHVLVCVGSALVMITSQFASSVYDVDHEFDITRMGAQVISGVGFLGAGTILKDGISVRGLTTAASLWVISCVGLAVGIGFYSGAMISTLTIFIVLQFLKKWMHKKNDLKVIHISMMSLDITLSKILKDFERYNLQVITTDVTESSDGMKTVKYTVSPPLDEMQMSHCIENLRHNAEIINIFVE
jgi:putative Mg2+ transporter-C (MgtC) family protein